MRICSVAIFGACIVPICVLLWVELSVHVGQSSLKNANAKAGYDDSKSYRNRIDGARRQTS